MKKPAPGGYLNLMFWSDHGGSRHLSIPRRWLKYLKNGLIGAGILALFFFGRYAYLEYAYRTRATNEQNRRQFEELQRELQKSNEKGQELQKQLNELSQKVSGASYSAPELDPAKRFVPPEELSFSTQSIGELTEEVSLYREDLDNLEAQVRATQAEIDSRLEKLRSIPSRYPVSSPSISSSYGWRANPMRRSFSDFHPGIDFRGAPGDDVYATADGVVTEAAWKAGYGRRVIINHGNGFESLYAHNRLLLVRAGQQVTRGTVIAHLGNSGHSTGPHVHYEIHFHGATVNPSAFLRVTLAKLPDLLRRYKG